MKKKRILFLAYGSSDWVGGLYYIKNALVTIMQSEEFLQQWEPVVVTEAQNCHMFAELEDNIILVSYNPRNAVTKRLFHAWLIYRYGIQIIYPIAADCRFWRLHQPFLGWFQKHEICWIPDFQHLYLPEFFSKEEIEKRDEAYRTVAQNCKMVVLSSVNAQEDFINRYHAEPKKTAVLHFISAIQDEVDKLNASFCRTVMEKFSLRPEEYIYIPNQFWQHKNHITVLKMIAEYAQEPMLSKYSFVFTGNLEDERNREHIEKLKQFIANTQIENRLKVLGFIDRADQLAIMKNARLIIQPSLFEGWGTVLEDCKILGKQVVLSDIPLHREQMDENCTLFSKQDTKSLYAALCSALEVNAQADFAGIRKAKDRAREYSREFVKMLDMM